jgi:hypothetical protein
MKLMNERNDIEQELNEIGNQLKNMSRTVPFEVPNGYFESLQDELKVKLATSELPASHPYHPPPDYFNQLPLNIIAKVRQGEPVSSRGRTISFKLRWAAAASLLVAASLAWYLLKDRPGDLERQLADIPASEVGTYVDINIDEFGPELLATEAGNLPATPLTHDIGQEDILEYLGGADINLNN